MTLNEIGKNIKAIDGVSAVFVSMNNDLIVYLNNDVDSVRNQVKHVADNTFSSISFRVVDSSQDDEVEINVPEIPF